MNKHFKSEFSKNVATLFTGTLVAQSIPIIVAPILSRIYTPEDFAVNEIFLRLFAVGIVFATLRYEQAIVLPKENKKAISILFLIFKIAFISSLFFFMLNLLFGKWVEVTQQIPNLYYYLFILPVALIISANYQSLTYWGIRNKSFKQLSIAKGIVSSTNSGYRIAIGIVTSGHPIGLVSSLIFSQLMGVIALLKGNLKTFFSFSRNKEKGELITIAKEYSDFPKINTLHALLDASREAIIVYLIFTFFGDMMLGLYAFTIRLMKLPLGMIGSAIGQVFFQKAADTVNQEGNLYFITLKAVKRLSLISLPIFIGIGLFAGWGFEFIFGDKWLNAGKIAQIITPWMFFLFLNSPLSQVPLIVKKQKEVFLISIIGFIFGVSSLLFGGLVIKEIYQSLLLFSITQSCYLLFVLLWILKIAKNYDNSTKIIE